jgi:hypothetical protein
MSILTDDEIEAFETEKGFAVIPVDVPVSGWTFLFKMPSEDQFTKFQGDLLGDREDSKAKASRFLCGGSVVRPERAEFLELCKKFPGIPIACVAQVTKAAGVEGVAREKKSKR